MVETDNRVQLPMKWHKFLIYFSLWAGVATNVCNAVMVLTGMNYGDSETAAAVYAYYKGMQSLDAVYALLLIGHAIYMVVVRFMLARYKAAAVRNLMSLYILSGAVELIYFIGILCIAGGDVASELTRTLLQGFVGCTAGMLVNFKYYAKRRHLFVN